MSNILSLSNDIQLNRANIQPIANSAYQCVGQIANIEGTAFGGSGVATVVKLTENILKIDYIYQITTLESSSSFSWGLNKDILKSLNSDLASLNITPISGGVCEFIDSNGCIIPSLEGYGGTHESANQFWHPARNYDGVSIGGYSLNDLISQNVKYIKGVCYATY